DSHGPDKDDGCQGGGGGGRVAEPGRDLNVVRWHVREEDLLLLDGSLPDEALPEPEFGADVLPRSVGVARQQAQVRLVARRVDDVEDAVLRRDDGRELR